MERMTGFDASLLYLETSQQMLVVGGILIVDVSALDFEYTFDRVRTELARRVKEIPEFRRKIYDSPLNLGHPAWVEEYDLDVTQHVRRVVVDAPGDDSNTAAATRPSTGPPSRRPSPWNATTQTTRYDAITRRACSRPTPNMVNAAAMGSITVGPTASVGPKCRRPSLL